VLVGVLCYFALYRRSQCYALWTMHYGLWNKAMDYDTDYGLWTAYSIQHTAYSIQHTAYSIQHTAYSIQRTHPAPCALILQVFRSWELGIFMLHAAQVSRFMCFMCFMIHFSCLRVHEYQLLVALAESHVEYRQRVPSSPIPHDVDGREGTQA
jgi:hypothetical protein